MKKRSAILIGTEDENEVAAILIETERRKSQRKIVKRNESAVQVHQRMIENKAKLLLK